MDKPCVIIDVNSSCQYILANSKIMFSILGINLINEFIPMP